MSFFGYPIGEWSVLLGIVVTIVTIIYKAVGKSVSNFTKQTLLEFKDTSVTPLMDSMNKLSVSFDNETKRINEQQKVIMKQLDEHEDKLEEHEHKLIEYQVQQSICKKK